MPNSSDLTPRSKDDEASVRQPDDGQAPSSSSSMMSIVGMGLVSAINIGCVAYIAYHFTNHADAPAQVAKVDLRPGNVSLEPASTFVLTIASHVEQTRPFEAITISEIPAAAVASPSVDTALPDSPQHQEQPPPEVEVATAKALEQEDEHWVQLGALSKMETARSFWSTLQERYGDLLGPYQPSFVGPDEVGGHLYHLRVGPLPASLAVVLCSDLQQAGGDCFCITADEQDIDHTVPKAPDALAEPS